MLKQSKSVDPSTSKKKRHKKYSSSPLLAHFQQILWVKDDYDNEIYIKYEIRFYYIQEPAQFRSRFFE